MVRLYFESSDMATQLNRDKDEIKDPESDNKAIKLQLIHTF